MSTIRLRWFLSGTALFALAASGCDVSVGSCDKDDAGECVDLFPDEDGGDAGGKKDSGAADAGADSAASDDADTDAESGDANTDAGDDAAVAEPLDINAFCAEVVSPGAAWATTFNDIDCCTTNEGTSQEAKSILGVYGYSDSATTDCIKFYDDLVKGKAPAAGTVTFDGRFAHECAVALNETFPPPAACPAAGFDAEAIVASAGHGAQRASQIPSCRKTFAGKLARDAECDRDIECGSGLVCMPSPGGAGSRACQPVLGIGGLCEESNDCGSGLTCVGSTKAQGVKQCVAVTDLVLSGSCADSRECVVGRVCGSDNKCTPAAVTAPADFICGT